MFTAAASSNFDSSGESSSPLSSFSIAFLSKPEYAVSVSPMVQLSVSINLSLKPLPSEEKKPVSTFLDSSTSLLAASSKFFAAWSDV